jgi:hypothetical protein
MLNKKRMLEISGGGMLVALVTLYFFSGGTPTSSCQYVFDFYCLKKLIALSFAIFIPIFFLSAFIFRMNEEIFLLWKKFTINYIYIYIIIILINPWQPADFSPFEKKTAFMVLVPLYALISIILIAVKSWKLKSAKKEI